MKKTQQNTQLTYLNKRVRHTIYRFFAVLLLSGLLMTFFAGGATLHAQTTEQTPPSNIQNVETPENGVDINLRLGEQSPWSKYVTIYMTVTSTTHDIEALQINIDAPAQISGDINPKGALPLPKGSSRTYTIKIKAATPGTYNIAFEAIEWTTDTNLTASKNATFVFDKNLLLVPRTPKYTQNLIIKYIVYTLLFGILIALGAYGGKLGIKKLKTFLAPPQY